MNNTNNTNTTANKKIGAIWSRTSTTGNEMLSIQLEFNGNKYNFVAFRNDYKTEDKHPDFVIQLAQKQPTQAPSVQQTSKKTAEQLEAQRNQLRNAKSKAQPITQSRQSVSVPDDNDDTIL
jgi:uncharacterized protein (DUF736 family)